jgi:hypothetical protein
MTPNRLSLAIIVCRANIYVGSNAVMHTNSVFLPDLISRQKTSVFLPLVRLDLTSNRALTLFPAGMGTLHVELCRLPWPAAQLGIVPDAAVRSPAPISNPDSH